jgi:transposase InsO family protein
MDIKKQAKILPGGGWRTHGRKASSGQHHRTKTGYAFVHSAIDAHRRLAYSKVHANEQAVTMMAFWRRALTFSKATASWSNEWMTDNGSCYRSKDFVKLLVAQSIRHTFIKPYRPQTNGKVERFNRTLLNKWAYARPYRSEAARTRALDNGSICTTITGTRRPSEDHPSVASTTWLGRTSSPISELNSDAEDRCSMTLHTGSPSLTSTTERL